MPNALTKLELPKMNKCSSTLQVTFSRIEAVIVYVLGHLFESQLKITINQL